MQSKAIAIIAVAILLVAGIGAAFVLMNDDKEEEKAEHTGRLTIFGNANNDDYLDSSDVDLIKEYADGKKTWSVSENPYADVNGDGKIDSTDVSLAQALVDRTAKSVRYVDANQNVAEAEYPIRDIAVTGTYAVDGVVILGLTGNVVGMQGSKSWPNSAMWNDLKDKPKIGTGAGMVDFEMVSKIDHIDAIVSSGSFSVDNKEQYTAQGIDIVNLPFGEENEVDAFLILGYMTGMEERSHKIAEFYDRIYDARDKALADNPELSQQTALLVYMEKWVYSDAGGHGFLADSLGIENIWKYDSSKDASNYVKILGGEEWLKNGEWQADWVIGQEKWLYNDDSDPASAWKSYQNYYGAEHAFPEKCILINDSLTLCLKVAYLMEYLFPGSVESGFGVEMHQYFIDNFVDCLSGSYDVTKHGTFLITYDDVKDRI